MNRHLIPLSLVIYAVGALQTMAAAQVVPSAKLVTKPGATQPAAPVQYQTRAPVPQGSSSIAQSPVKPPLFNCDIGLYYHGLPCKCTAKVHFTGCTPGSKRLELEWTPPL